jgi:hypothetical protein
MGGKLICTDISQQITDRYNGILLVFNPACNVGLRVTASTTDSDPLGAIEGSDRAFDRVRAAFASGRRRSAYPPALSRHVGLKRRPA